MDVYRTEDRLGLVYTLTSPNIPIKDYECFLDKTVVTVATGGQHCLFLMDDHIVYACGFNQYGQLGLGVVSSEAVTEPQVVECLLGADIVDISCGLNHSAAVTSSGLVYTWGSSDHGQCGTGDLGIIVPSPTLIAMHSKSQACIHGVEEPNGRVKVKQVSCGDTHTVALTSTGEVWTWGSGIQLGIVSLETSLKPTRLDFMLGRNVLMVSAGGQHTLALIEKSVLTGAEYDLDGYTGANTSHTSSLCSECKKDVYQYSMTSSLLITDHDQKCPLGLDLQEVSVQEDVRQAAQEVGSGIVDDGHMLSDNLFTDESSFLESPGAVCLQDVDIKIDDVGKSAGTISGAVGQLTSEPVLQEPTGNNSKEDGNAYVTTQSSPCDIGCDLKEEYSIPPEKTELASGTYQLGAGTTEMRSDELTQYDEKDTVELTEKGATQCNMPEAANGDFVDGSSELSEEPISEIVQLESLNVDSGPQKRHLFASEKEAKEYLSKRLSDHEVLEQASENEQQIENGSTHPIMEDLSAVVSSMAGITGQVKSISSKMFKSSIGGMFSLASKNDVELEPAASGSNHSNVSSAENFSKISKGDEVTTSFLYTDQRPNVQSSPRLSRSSRVSSIFESKRFDPSLNAYDVTEDVQGPTSNEIASTKRRTQPRKSKSHGQLQVSPELLTSSYETKCSIQTEVWSWGCGVRGQLGHGDRLDRPQPCLILSLIGQEVIKVSAGGQHSLAVTATGKAFAWGDNSAYQLAGSETLLSGPRNVKLLSNVSIWDVSAGQTCSLFLADGMGFQPDLYYCGGETRSVMETSAFRFASVKKVGWLKQIHAGGDLNACIVDKNITGHLATLHEFAATERCFYQLIHKFLHNVLKPFVASDELASVQTDSLVSTLNKMVEDYTTVSNKVGLNTCELVMVLQTSSKLCDISLVGDASNYVNTFLKFTKSFGDFLALGGFDQIHKIMSPFLERRLIDLGTLIEEAKLEKSSNVTVMFRRLLQLPLRRMKDYERLTGKLAVGSSESTLLLHVSELWDQLKQTARLDHTAADSTRLFWDNCTPKFVEQFRKPSRRLLRESKTHPLTLQNAGSFSFHWFLLFNDSFVHMRYSSHQSFPLSTLWTESLQDEDHLRYTFKLLFPESSRILSAPDSAQKSEWLAAINMAVDGVLNNSPLSHLRSEVSAARSPPLSRHASFTFNKSGSLSGAHYSGMWYCGHMYGEGELSWADGRKYVGLFKHGVQHGYGVLTIPNPDKEDEVQEGNWKEGQLNGLGKIKYVNGDVYEGHFLNGLRQGHGVYRQGLITSPVASLYIGEWLNDKRSGYGVMDDVILGEKYMGMWLDDNRHGNGILVTMDGMYLEGSFAQNKLTGRGLMWTEDNTCYDGEFYAGTQLYGRGSLILPSGHTIDGHFSGSWNDGIKVNGTFRCPTEAKSPHSSSSVTRPAKYGKWSVPADRKWAELFTNCRSSLGCHGNTVIDSSKAWEAVAVKVSSGRKSLRDNKESHARGTLSVLEHLEKIPPHKTGSLSAEYYTQIKDYLIMAFDTPFHPLGKLMDSLVNVYRATYIGVGAHPKLLHHAVGEVESFVKRLYDVVRILFPDLPQGGDPVHIDSSQEEREDDGLVVAAGSLLHPILLPRIYPPLFTLYALYNEKDDELYWERIQRWNRQPDIALMSYLGVDQKFWCVDDSIPLQRISRLKDHCYASAVDTLQQLSTMFSPADKLTVIQQTFDEVTKSVQTILGSGYLWNMDDLFPVFQYITVRARIRHLSAEIHMIDDLMERHFEHGELGIMFTTLKACHYQVLNEKMNI